MADALLLESVTETPPAGAAALRVTVPVVEVPPVTVAGPSETDERAAAAAAGVTVSVVVLLTLL